MSLPTPAAYLAAVDARIADVHRSGVHDFAGLLGACHGADPVTVAQRVRAADLPVAWGGPAWTPLVYRPELHPLRSEWYFTGSCAAELATRFGQERIVCLGAPTVAAAAPDALLVDRDATTISARFGARIPDVLSCDLSTADDIPVRHAVDTVVMDPPWYSPHPLRWLALAARAVRTGGTLAMVVPPPLQRPGAEQERAAVLAAAQTLGPSRIEPDAVRYATPLFEAIALQAAGIEVSAAWRCADLLVVRVQRPPAATTPPAGAAATSPTTDVETFTIGEQVVTLGPRCRPGSPALSPVVGTRRFVWDRISTRDERLPSIDIWTSRSRVASVHGRPEVRRVLAALGSGAAMHEACPEPHLARAMATLLDRAG